MKKYLLLLLIPLLLLVVAWANVSLDQNFTGKVNLTKWFVDETEVTATATELNLTDGLTATTTELNLIDGVTATTTELNRVDDNFVVGTTTVTTAGPTDDLDISGANVVYIDTSSNDVTLGGTTGGADGQIVQFVIIDATGNATIEHTEGVNQDFYLVDGGDQTITTSYGGWTFVCNGTNLYEVDHD